MFVFSDQMRVTPSQRHRYRQTISDVLRTIILISYYMRLTRFRFAMRNSLHTIILKRTSRGRGAEQTALATNPPAEPGHPVVIALKT